MKRTRECSSVGLGTDDENPEPASWGEPTAEVGRLGRAEPREGRHLPGVLDWDKEKDLGDYLRERGALELMTRSDLRGGDIYILQRMAARCALEEMGEQLEFSEAYSLRAETIMAAQQKTIRSLEAKLYKYNLGVLVPEDEEKDSDEERWVTEIAEREKDRARALQLMEARRNSEGCEERNVSLEFNEANKHRGRLKA